MKKIALALAALFAIAGACSAAGSPGTNGALPAGSDQFPTETTSDTTPVTTAPAASTCDVAREAFLTGTPAEIDAALEALIADKTADATAREYADYYLNRDAGDASMRDMDKSLIRMACS